MLSPTDVKVLKVTESSQLGASGRPEATVTITFTVGTHGPFSESFPKATFDPASANLRIKEFASKLALLPGA